MIERHADRLMVTASLVMDNARGLLQAGCEALHSGDQVLDFSRVAAADSSALAVMLGWMRAAASSQSSIKFANVPRGVLSLAELYGIADLLPLA